MSDLFKLKSPCKDCPFRKDKNFLRKGRIIEIWNGLMNDEFFPCHKTVNDTSSGRWTELKAEWKFCAGALILMSKEDALPENRNVRLAEMLNMFDEKELMNTDLIHDNIQQMIKANY